LTGTQTKVNKNRWTNDKLNIL